MDDRFDRDSPEESPAEAKDLLWLWFEGSPLGMTLADVHGRTFKINHVFAEMLGHTVQELFDSADQSQFTHPDDIEIDHENIERLLAGDESIARWEKRYIHADGHIVWARVTASLLRAQDGTPRVLISQIEDMTSRKEMAHLLDLAQRDSLTGLRNRAAFERAAAEQIARCKRYGEQAALLLLDLDGLKQINDTHGHVVGDEALRTVGEAISKRLRTSDLAARLGGDEFVLLLPHTTSTDAERVAHEIERAIAHTSITTRTAVVHPTASIGVAQIDADTPDIQAALRNADTSMYGAKRRRPASDDSDLDEEPSV
jgi:diguanylate cyclase (GGDEF)-like protein/PAS domain S-box-containing protein